MRAGRVNAFLPCFSDRSREVSRKGWPHKVSAACPKRSCAVSPEGFADLFAVTTIKTSLMFYIQKQLQNYSRKCKSQSGPLG